MDVLMSGATGLIGSALVPELEAAGHRVSRLTRTPRSEGDIRWDPASGDSIARAWEGWTPSCIWPRRALGKAVGRR